ncbi:MAG: 30S ribosome-binding factor RbfA [Methylophaga sp.]|nr:30S ribosome-binding factor RbfA [Methylophaga sp.]
MAKEYSRTSRISEVVMRELALLIQQEISDPRVGMVTVSHADVTADLKYCKVYVTRLNGFDSEQDIETCLEGLQNAAGFLRRELGKRVNLRNIPELRFLYDKSLERGFYMDALIAKANADNKQD